LYDIDYKPLLGDCLWLEKHKNISKTSLFKFKVKKLSID
jgi:hypothetical protein